LRILTFEELDSTDSEALRRAEAGADLPLWIITKAQTSGRGRRGREWVSQPGNLFCSGLYSASDDAGHDSQKSFVAALAIYEALAEYVSPDLLSIKWPNDVLLDGKKVSGILLERTSNALCIGVGINLLSRPEIDDQETACVIDYIEEALINDPEPILEMPEPVLAILAAKYTQWSTRHDAEGFAPIRDAWRKRAAGLGGAVRVNLANESFTGYAKGLGEDGAFIVQLDNGDRRSIHAGDVFFEGG
jgi:BirA family biotin operon repressor/biotin-[acetyl-CoA-carboxylase] ligase